MNRTFIVLPRTKRHTLKNRDVWLLAQDGSKWLMNGEITVPCSTDKIMQIISNRFESEWRLTFGHKEESK